MADYTDQDLNPWAQETGGNYTDEDLNPWGTPEPTTVLGEIPRGLKAGVQQLRGMGYGLGALAGKAVESEGMKKWAEEGLDAVEKATPKPSVASIGDIQSASDMGKYLAYGVATNLPNMLLSLATGGIGGGLTWAAMRKTAGEAILKKAVERGAIAGAGAASLGMEAGSISADQLTETGEVHPLRVMMGAVPAAMLDVVPEWYLAKRLGWFGGAGSLAGGRMARAGKAFGSQFAIEAPTEAAQSVIERASVPGKSISNAEAWDEYINSFFLGGMTGGVVGGIGGIFSKAKQKKDTDTSTQKILSTDPTAQGLEVAIVQADPEGVTSLPPMAPGAYGLERTIPGRELGGPIGGQEPPPPPGAGGIGGTFTKPSTPAPAPTPAGLAIGAEGRELAGPGMVTEEKPKSAPISKSKKTVIPKSKETIRPEGYGTERAAKNGARIAKLAPGTFNVMEKEGRWHVNPLEAPTPEQIKKEAEKAATSPTNKLPEPTEEQKKAGNYKMGHVNIQGLDISIENPAGSVRKGVDENGKPWETPIKHHYGYIKKTEGKDGDHVDVFVGKKPESPNVYIVDQKDPKTGKFDEHKVMIGFKDRVSARKGYLANYDKSGASRIMGVTEMPMEQFKEWIKGDTTQPVSKPRRVSQAKLAALRNQVKAKRGGAQTIAGVLRKMRVDFSKDYTLKHLKQDIPDFMKIQKTGAMSPDDALAIIKEDYPGIVPVNMTADEFVEMGKRGEWRSTGTVAGEGTEYGLSKSEEARINKERAAWEEGQEADYRYAQEVKDEERKAIQETKEIGDISFELEGEGLANVDKQAKEQQERLQKLNAERESRTGNQSEAAPQVTKANITNETFEIQGAGIKDTFNLAPTPGGEGVGKLPAEPIAKTKEMFKKEDQLEMEGSWETQADALNITFNGMQERLNKPALPTFTDKETGTTFLKGEDQTLEEALSRARGPFVQSTMPSILINYGRSDFSPGTDALLNKYEAWRKSKEMLAPQQVVDAYEEATDSPFPYAWMTKMLDARGVKITFNAGLLTNRDRAAAAYDKRDNIIIYGDRLNLYTDIKEMWGQLFAHEGIHAVIENELKGKTQLGIELKSKLLNFIKDLNKKTIPSGFVTRGIMIAEVKEPTELITLAFTNPEFASWLDSIKVEGQRTPSQTFWGKLKDIIAGWIVKMPGVRTKLDELNDIMDTVFKIEPPTVEQAQKDIAPGTREQLFMPFELSNTMKRTIGTLESTFLRNPQSLPKDLIDKISKKFMAMEKKDLKSYDYFFSNPFHMSQKYPQWKRLWQIHGIERQEKRSSLRAEHVGYADAYFNLDKQLNKEGKNSQQRKEAKDRVVRMVFATDVMLHEELVGLKEEAQGATEARQEEIQNRINDILSLRRYSDIEVSRGIIDEYGKKIKLSSPAEIAAYSAVRFSMDKMMEAKVDWLNTMAFRKWKDQKWYNLLLQAAGMDLTKENVQNMVGKQGLNSAAINYAKKIQVNLGNIMDRINKVLDEQEAAGAYTDELVNVAERYKAISDKVQEELAKFQTYLSHVTGIKDKEELTKLTRDVFSAYMQTRPYLKQIKGLRNQMNDWVGYAPRTREQGKYKVRLVENIYDEETGALVRQDSRYSVMTNSKKDFIQKHADIMKLYADKNGNLPPEHHIISEPVTVSPEMAFQGVNDINTQKIIDDAIQNMQLKDTYYNDKGEKIDIHDQLRDAAFQSIANQFMQRGAARAKIHRKQETVKGYDEENLDRVLLGYISSMTGLMTKQLAAADAIDLLKGETNRSMFAGLSKYNSEMLRNDSIGDKRSGMARSFAFIWFLGGLMKSAAINLTQNPIVGFAELSKYMREHNLKGIGDVEYAKALKDVLSDNLNANEKALIRQLVTSGIAQDRYIQSVFEGLGTAYLKPFYKASRWLATPFSMTEVYNRKSAGVAIFRQAYPMYIKQGLSHEDAMSRSFDDTRTFIDNVHYAYGKANRPLIMQSGDFSSKLMHTAYTFRGFTHNFLIRQATLLSQGDWRTMVKTLAYMGVFGGLMGLPLFKDFFDWIEKTYGKSPTKIIRKTLRGIGGKTLEEFGMTGLPSVLGANISGSLAIGLPYPIGSETPEDTIFGVYGGMMEKGKRAGQAFGREDYMRGLTEVSPEVLRNPIVAARESRFGKEVFGTPGFTTTPRGKIVYDEEGKPLRIKGTEVALKTLGFNPAEFSRQREKEQTVKRQTAWVAEEKRDAGEEYRVARLKGDPKALKNMMDRVKEINQKIKSRDLRHLVPPATVAKIIQSSKESMTKTRIREQKYKHGEL
jgi:hypothetical protein